MLYNSNTFIQSYTLNSVEKKLIKIKYKIHNYDTTIGYRKQYSICHKENMTTFQWF